MHTALLVTPSDDISIKTQLVSLPEDFGLNEMYMHIQCDMVDVAGLTEDIDIWVDDNGLFKPGNTVLEYKLKGNPEEPLHLAGNALFLSSDDEGNSIGLTMEQLNWIGKELMIRHYGMTRGS